MGYGRLNQNLFLLAFGFGHRPPTNVSSCITPLVVLQAFNSSYLRATSVFYPNQVPLIYKYRFFVNFVKQYVKTFAGPAGIEISPTYTLGSGSDAKLCEKFKPSVISHRCSVSV